MGTAELLTGVPAVTADRVLDRRSAEGAAAVGDCGGDRGHLERAGLHLALAYRGRADVEFTLDLGGSRKRAFDRARHPDGWLKP